MSFPMDHEELMPAFGVHCNCDVLEVTPAGGPGAVTSTQIIRTDQDFRITFDWETSGWLNYLIAGKWVLSVFVEKIGEDDASIPSPLGRKERKSERQPYHYECSDSRNWIDVPAGTVSAGVYKLVTTMTFEGNSGYRAPIALFGEGQMLQFYDVGLED